jgi:hypothetical protein
MDLFYGTTFEESLKRFKSDLKQFAREKYNIDFGKKNIKIAYGHLEVGDCTLVITPPLSINDKPFQDKQTQYLINLLNEFNIDKFVITSCFLIPKLQVSKNDIKAFSPWIELLTDIFNPKVVVVLGEDAQFSFVKQKHTLKDYHGEVIASARTSAKVILTYPMSYYIDRSEFEDSTYKDFIKNSDWSNVAKLYKGGYNEF